MFHLQRLAIFYIFICVYKAAADHIKLNTPHGDRRSGELIKFKLFGHIDMYRGDLMGEPPQTEYKEINIWKTEPTVYDTLEKEHKIISHLNEEDSKRKFPNNHLIGEIQTEDGIKNNLYEIRFFGRLAIDIVAAAAQHEVPDLLKEMGRHLVRDLEYMHRVKKHFHRAIEGISIIETEDGFTLINFHNVYPPLDHNGKIDIEEIRRQLTLDDLYYVGKALTRFMKEKNATIPALREFREYFMKYEDEEELELPGTIYDDLYEILNK